MSNHFPSAIDLADDTLASKPHSTLHGNLGDTLSDFVDALGKVDLTGFINKPTLFDPSQTAWDDAGFLSFAYNASISSLNLTAGSVHGNTAVGGNDTGTNRSGTVSPSADSDAGTEFVIGGISVSIDADGTNRSADLDLTSDLAGFTRMTLTDTQAVIVVKGNAGQTDPLLDLQDSDAATIFKVSPPSASGNVEGFLQVPSGHAFIQQRATQDAGSDARQTLWDWYSETDTSSVYADISVTTNALADGSSRAARAVFSSDLDGTVTFEVSEFGAAVTVKGNAGQTNPLLDVQDSAAASLFSVAPNGRVLVSPPAGAGSADCFLVQDTSGLIPIINASADGKLAFFTGSPVAQQTGVAVSAPGIHAALVNLGLITA